MTNSTNNRTDKRGFPITECGRCGGSGRYSYNTMHGDRCYGCSGTGWVHTKGAAKPAAEYREAMKAQSQTTCNNIEPGDKIRRMITSDDRAVPVYARNVKGDEWVEVVETEVLYDQPCGWGNTHGKMREEWTPEQWATRIVWADGRETVINNHVVARYNGGIDPAPFLARVKG